jgi:hypothetical protein
VLTTDMMEALLVCCRFCHPPAGPFSPILDDRRVS